MIMKQKADINNIPFPETGDLERVVLADVVSCPETLGDIIPIVLPDFFTTDARRGIWNAIVKRYNSGEGTDLTSMVTICGEAFINDVIPYLGKTGSAFSVMQHVSLLRDGATKRRAYLAALSFLQAALSPQSTEQDILASVEQFSRNVEGPSPLQSEKKLVEIINEIADELQDAASAKVNGKMIKITSGFRQIDWWTYGGFSGGQLITLAARPSVGKTAVMLHMAKAAAESGSPAFVFTLEMTPNELGKRLMLSVGKINQKDIAKAEIDWQAFEETSGELSPLPLYIENSSRSFDEIVSKITRAVKQGKCRIVFIDYLGLIRDVLNVDGRAMKPYQVIGRITGELKALAKRLNIPIVLLSQLNRENVREKRAPELQDLRDSGSIEQDSDIVIMLEPRPLEKRVYMWMRKNRNGKRDEALVLVPNETYTSFEEGNVVSELEDPKSL